MIYFGTSSWKYTGWKGLIYHDTYASEKDFGERSLTEYSQRYPCVGVDHTYYAWPTTSLFGKYVDQTPESFRFLLKATEEVTVFDYPSLKRYGKRSGTRNPNFLNADLFIEKFLEPLRLYAFRLGPILFEFSRFYPGMLRTGGEFVDRLDRFFDRLKQEAGFSFAVEIRNGNWLERPYFDCLARHRLSHVYNSWTHMPSLAEQLERSQGFRPAAYIARLLLRPGVRYETAVEAYFPYDRIQDEQLEVRAAAAALAKRAKAEKLPAYILVNNRCEGCAPKTIEAIEALISSSPASG